jgi:FG-GAP-like repeat/Tetratricopeptide repeat/ASPIC and UnbV
MMSEQTTSHSSFEHGPRARIFHIRALRLFVVVALAVAVGLCADLRTYPSANQNVPIQSSREDAYRANNIGVALLEQFKYKEAAGEFRRALRINPSLALARVNLAIALYYALEVEDALREIKAAVNLLPSSPQIHYILGLIARAQNRTPDAIAEFQQVLKIDSRDPATNINLGQLLMQQRKYPEAIAALRSALASEPYSVTASYSLAIALTRSSESQEGQATMKKFQALREKPYATTLGKDYLEQGRYAEAIASSGAEAEIVDAVTPDVTFTDATSSILPNSPGTEPSSISEDLDWRSLKAKGIDEKIKRQLVAASGGVVPFDFDGDGDLDLLEVGVQSIRLYRNDGGKFVDVTEQSGLRRSTTPMLITAVVGDYDNDGRPDILMLGYGRLTLYHNDGNGKFSDVTAAAGIPSYPYLALSAAFVDVDHDGDLDIFIAGFVDLSKMSASDPSQPSTFPDDFSGAPNLLLRNDGNGKFTDITSAAKVAGSGGHAVAVVPSDFDNHRDIDLLVVNYGSAPTLYSNQRDGTFRDVAAEVGLNVKGRFTCAAAGDVNKDDFTDFFFGRADGPGVFAMSDGKGHFVTTPAPSGTEGLVAAQFLDYDNDGLLDLVVLSGESALVFRNLGTRWENVTDHAVASGLLKRQFARAFATADIDGDGDTDLIFRVASGDLKVARNDGGNKNRSLKVQLAGRVSNRSAAGAKIEARAGSLKQKLETYAATPSPAPADIVFGLGKRAGVDAVRVLWPAGIVQAETDMTTAKSSGPLGQLLKITELDRKPSSCPFLYAWNGERFEFVTDFMGGGEMGYWEAPGVRNHPDPDEYVRIRDDQLKSRDGRYELRITNELEEVLYFDRLQLISVAHPADTEIYPNEGMTDPPRQFKLFETRGARPPVAAVDDHGHDVLSRIAKLDRQYPDDFALHNIRGYAAKHTLTLDLGEPSKGRTLLLLTGWTDYAFSSDNMAAHQGGLSLAPPEFQVKDARGQWRTAIADIGIPVGRPQTIVADLTGKFPTLNREVRIVTNMRIYWDQILVDTSSGDAPGPMVRLELISARLHWRGFSAEVSPDGREPFSYDYYSVSLSSPWKTMPGHYTREGDVRGLLARTDDMFVISKPGDEIALSFDATKLPRLPQGWKRTFLLYADGFSKEMDINSASPDQVAPLPFHAMKSYPGSSYPAIRSRREYVERYNTRVVASPVPRIETVFALKNH